MRERKVLGEKRLPRSLGLPAHWNMGRPSLSKPSRPRYTVDVRKNMRRSDWERCSLLIISCVALLSHPAPAAEVKAEIPMVPDLAGPMRLGAAPIGALTLVPMAPALSAPAISVGGLTAIASPSLIPQGAPIGAAAAPLAAAVPLTAAAPSTERNGLAQAAVTPGKASVLAVLQERVAAVSKTGAEAEIEIPQLYQGKDSGAGAVSELSPSAAGFGTMGKSKMATLKDAVSLATKAHQGQKDKAGATYINHPLRVMSRMNTDEEKMAAVLHDVVEDTSVTLQNLRVAGYPKSVVDAVDALSRRKGETYEQFIERLKPNALARKVKIADLEDNMDLGRIPNPQPKDLERVEKYQKVWQELTALERKESAPDFKYYAIMVDGKARGLFAFNEGGKRLDMLSWNHQTKQWEHNPRTVTDYFISDLEAEEISRAKAEEIARGLGALVPSESDLMKISDQAEAKIQSRKK